VICPPPTRADLKDFSDLFIGAPAKSLELARHYEAMARANGVHFLDAGTLIESSTVDGFHFDPPSHAALGHSLVVEIKRMAGEP